MTSRLKTVASYGSWKSPITADLLVQKNISFGHVTVLRGREGTTSEQLADIAFVENRPSEKGRAALVKTQIDLKNFSLTESLSNDLTGGRHNVRAGVHEYGGGAVSQTNDGGVVYTDYDPKAWDVLRVGPQGEEVPRIVTPNNPVHRYASFEAHPSYDNLIACVLEDHTIDEPLKVVNSLVCLDTDGLQVHTIASGHDFYANPTFSPDGKYVAWVSWDHPSMPFWSTIIYVGGFTLNDEGRPILSSVAEVARQKDQEVLHQPTWSMEDDDRSSTLFFTSDRTDFANLFRVSVSTDSNGIVRLSPPTALLKSPIAADFQPPAWTLNNSPFSALSADWLVCSPIRGGLQSLALIHLPTSTLRELETPFVGVAQLRRLSATSVILVGIRHDEPSTLLAVDLSSAIEQGANVVTERDIHVIKRSSDMVYDGTVGKEWLSQAEDITFPTKLADGGDATSHALLYRPTNPNFVAPDGESPPCIIQVHGGPTSSAMAGLSLDHQYWTSRGWAICRVNYGGSTGYGRSFLERLNNNWGITDVEDCVAAAKYLGTSPSSSSAHVSKKSEFSMSRSVELREQESCFSERKVGHDAVEVRLRNHRPAWGSLDLAFAASAGALSFFSTDFASRYALAGAVCGWLLRKAFRVQYESVTAHPGLGLQLETVRGLSWPFAQTSQSFFKTISRGKLIPRNRIVDVIVNESFKGWSVRTYAAVMSRPTASQALGNEEPKLEVLLPNLAPRAPLVQRLYRAIYPALFGKESLPSQQSEADPDGRPIADPSKIVISGGSAGGFTVLASLCLYPHAFSAGTSSYGVSDLKALARDSHKFESRYPIGLLGGLPDDVPEVYKGRSPLYMADRIRSPVLVLQGDLDKVVPPNQSEMMVDTIRKNGGIVKYTLFQGEGHGFRQAANLKRALKEEEEWYASVL